MKTSTLINEIIENIEKIVRNIKNYTSVLRNRSKKKKCNHIIYMVRRERIFNWNHVSENLTEDQNLS